MDSQKFLNIEPAFRRFVQGRASAEDEELLYKWVKETPENRKRLFQEKDIWDSTNLGTKQLNEQELEHWLELRHRMNSRKVQTSVIVRFAKIAAIIIISFGLGWFGRYINTQKSFSTQSSAEMKSVAATKGQQKEIFLADGTHVWLNADSKLSFPSEFTPDNREVELTGEAYFEVTANEKKPFWVTTGNHKVKVTGTKFNICEYPECKIIETTLVEGKVKIITGNFIKDLLPGQQSGFNTETAKIRINETDFEIYTAWIEGRYEFRNEPISKVFQIIERWWDVDINFPEELKNERISGVLRKYKPLEQHFEVIQQILPVDYKIENDVIEINFKRKLN